MTFSLAVLGESRRSSVVTHSWRTCFCAKLLFAIVCLHLPLLVSDGAVLKTLGLPMDLPKLVLRQLPQATLLIVPVWVLALVGRSLLRVIVSLVCVSLSSLAYSNWYRIREHGDPLSGVSDAEILLAIPALLLPVVALQLAQRPRFLGILAPLLVALMVGSGVARSRVRDGFLAVSNGSPVLDGRWSTIRIRIDRTRKSEGFAFGDGADGFCLPVDTSDVPKDVVLIGHGEARIGSPSELVHVFFSELRREVCFYYVPRGAWLDRDLNIRASIDVSVLNHKPSFQGAAGPAKIYISGVGVCSPGRRGRITDDRMQCLIGPIRRFSEVEETEDLVGNSRDSKVFHESIGDWDSFGRDHLMAGFEPIFFPGVELVSEKGGSSGYSLFPNRAFQNYFCG